MRIVQRFNGSALRLRITILRTLLEPFENAERRTHTAAAPFGRSPRAKHERRSLVGVKPKTRRAIASVCPCIVFQRRLCVRVALRLG